MEDIKTLRKTIQILLIIIALIIATLFCVITFAFIVTNNPQAFSNMLINNIPSIIISLSSSVLIGFLFRKDLFKIDKSDQLLDTCIDQQLHYGVVSYKNENSKDYIQKLIDEVKDIKIYTTWVNYSDPFNTPIWDKLLKSQINSLELYILDPDSKLLEERSIAVYGVNVIANDFNDHTAADRAMKESKSTIRTIKNNMKEYNSKSNFIVKKYKNFPSIQIYKFDDIALISLFGLSSEADENVQIVVRINKGILGKYVKNQMDQYENISVNY